MALKVAVASELNRNAGTYGSPTWSAVKIIREVRIPWTADEGDASCRISEYHLAEPTMKNVSLEFYLLHDPANTNFTAIRTAWLNKSVLDVVATDIPVATVGALGIRMECKVIDFSEEQEIDGLVGHRVVLKPCFPVDSSGPAAWTTSE